MSDPKLGYLRSPLHHFASNVLLSRSRELGTQTTCAKMQLPPPPERIVRGADAAVTVFARDREKESAGAAKQKFVAGKM